MIISLVSVAAGGHDQSQTDSITLDVRTGHGIFPNLSPSLAPALRSENSVKMKDLFNFDLLTGEDIEIFQYLYPQVVSGEVKLPNTWDSVPNFRYPYYDGQGRGFLLYGYGGPQLYNYSEFDRMEGYF